MAQFAQKRELTYLLAIDRPDPDSRGFGASFTYGIRGIPNCAVIDREGRIAYLGTFWRAAHKATELLAAGDDKP